MWSVTDEEPHCVPNLLMVAFTTFCGWWRGQPAKERNAESNIEVELYENNLFTANSVAKQFKQTKWFELTL